MKFYKGAKRLGGERESGRNDSGASGKVGETTQGPNDTGRKGKWAKRLKGERESGLNDPDSLYIYEPQLNTGRGLRAPKPDLRPPRHPRNLLLTVRRRCFCCG